MPRFSECVVLDKNSGAEEKQLWQDALNRNLTAMGPSDNCGQNWPADLRFYATDERSSFPDRKTIEI